jgi:hypothetical protein
VNAVEGEVDLSTVLLFASNKRLFSMNDVRGRGMFDFHNRTSETFYDIRGSAPLGAVRSLCREMKSARLACVGDLLVKFPRARNVHVLLHIMVKSSSRTNI